MPRRVLWVLAAGGLIVVILVGVAVLAGRGAPPPTAIGLESPLRIALLSPRPGSPTTVGIPVEVGITAFGARPLAAVEMWADGRLVEAVYPPDDPPTTHLPTHFVWIPSSEGRHHLVARVVDLDGNAAESNTVELIAQPRELVEEIKAGAGDDSPEAFAVGPGGQGPPVDVPAVPLPQPAPMPDLDEAAPAEPFQATWLPAWISGLIESAPPQAPELAGEADGCKVRLAIHDLSDNEAGFRLYRKADGEPQWALLAEVEGQSESDYIEHAAEVGPGSAWYRAVAFNAKGEAPSLPAWVDLASDACDGLLPETESTQITLIDLKSGLADQVYCYSSFGGALWQRLPAAGFFPSGPEGFEVDQLVAQLGLDLLPAKTPLEALDLECWGWAGAALQHLGNLHFDLGAAETGIVEVSTDLISAAIQVFPGYMPLGGEGDDLPSIEDFAVGGDPYLPLTFALVTDNVENCKTHLPSGGDNLLENLLFCTPYPEFSEDNQPYLTWWLLEGTCAAGKEADCYELDELQPLIDEHGGRFGFTVYDCDKSGLCYLHFFPMDLTAFVIPPFATCGEPRYFVAQFNVYLGPGEDPTLRGPGSPPFAYSIPCPEAYETAGFVDLDVGFESLTIGNADDGDGDGSETVEVFGKFRAQTSSGDDDRQLNRGEWGYSSADCPGNETFSPSLSTGGLDSMPECPRSLENGTYAISDLTLCQSDSTGSCFLWPENISTEYLVDNNHFTLRVLEGNAVLIDAVLVDYDAGSANDTVCHIAFSTPNWPLETWAGFSQAEFSGSQGDNGNASCKVIVSFTAVGP